MKHLNYLFALFFVTILGCETDIPEIDTTLPKFTFRITGDGFDHNFDQDTDFSSIQLNLKNGANYDFTYTGSDAGGVKKIQWQLPGSDYIQFGSDINSPWTIRNISILSRMIEWNGNVNNPLTGNVLAGNFEANGELVYGQFRFFVKDFGGESGSSNTIAKELAIYIGNHNTEIINQ